MRNRKKMVNNAVFNCLKNNILSLFAVVLWLILCQPAFGQGSLAETATTMEIQGELAGNEVKTPTAKPKPTPEANAVAILQDIERIEKVAQKLMRSMRSGKYDQADFSAVWNTVVPKDSNFSDGINAILRPVFEQFGKAEKLGQGKMAGANRAVFPAQFTGGTLNMTVSLDQQDKIVEWTLLPAATAGAELPKDMDSPGINDFNDFKQEINRIDVEARGEENEWLGRLERKAELAKAMDDVVVAELRFLRKLAETENAPKTVEAIDLVLKRRQERLEKLTTRIDEEAREERQQQVAGRRERRAGRAADRQDQTEQRTVRTRRSRPAGAPQEPEASENTME